MWYKELALRALRVPYDSLIVKIIARKNILSKLKRNSNLKMYLLNTNRVVIRKLTDEVTNNRIN